MRGERQLKKQARCLGHTRYDDNGSLISKITVGGDSYQYTYNVRNELSGATISRTERGHSVQIGTSYKYNDAGIRVESDETTTIDNGTPTTARKLFLIDGNNPTGYAQVLEQLAAVGGKPTVSYMFGNTVIGQTTAAGAAQYILADGHGSTRLLTDANAAILARFLYDAYGNILGQAVGALNLSATAILYTGQQFDPLLLEYYLRARYYDAAAGGFSARDSFPGRVASPLSLNRYVFVDDKPVNGADPSGMDGDLGSVMAAIGIALNFSSLVTHISQFSEAWRAGNFADASFYAVWGFFDVLFMAFGVKGLSGGMGPPSGGAATLISAGSFTNMSVAGGVFSTAGNLVDAGVADDARATFDAAWNYTFASANGPDHPNVGYRNSATGQNNEFDHVYDDLIVEDKSAPNSSFLTQMGYSGKSFVQVVDEWVAKHIVGKTRAKLDLLPVADETYGTTGQAVPSIEAVRGVRNYLFRINNNNPVFQQEVARGIGELAEEYPDWTFSAEFGK